MEPRYLDRTRDLVEPGDAWCPCLQNVLEESAGWPLALEERLPPPVEAPEVQWLEHELVKRLPAVTLATRARNC